MPSFTFAMRAGGLLAAAALASSLMACAAEPELQFIAPTMAPEQTLSEACAISGEDVDQLTSEAEQQIRDALDQAGTDLANGQIPPFAELSGSLDETLMNIEGKLSNTEVLAAIAQVRASLQEVREISQPESPLGVPGYLASLGAQLNEVAQVGKQLQDLCTTQTEPEAAQ